MSDARAVHIVDNPGEQRFEARVDGRVAFAQYIRRPGEITFTHTEVPEELQGHGLANALARTALDAARGEGLAVVPRCPFIASYIARHPEYQALVKRRG
jgi:predicted GNAT family acetyltransferase